MRHSGELKQQHGREDSQGFAPKRPQAGATADAGLGAEREPLRGFGVRSTVVHGSIVGPTGAVSQAPAARGSEYRGHLGGNGYGDRASTPGDFENEA